jgi:hypothetical protein
MTAEYRESIDSGKLWLYELALAQDDPYIHLVPARSEKALCGRTGPWRRVSNPQVEGPDCQNCLNARLQCGVYTATIVGTLDWPISRCKGQNLDTWEFVEEVKGTYEDAMKRAAELQGETGAEWQYRIWDCR